jgi:hypothetical protein
MKGFLSSIRWYSENEEWSNDSHIAKVSKELFVYHVEHCLEEECPVRECNLVRNDEFTFFQVFLQHVISCRGFY